MNEKVKIATLVSVLKKMKITSDSSPIAYKQQ